MHHISALKLLLMAGTRIAKVKSAVACHGGRFQIVSRKVPDSSVGDRSCDLILLLAWCLSFWACSRLLVRSFTYFTTEHVSGPLGFFTWEVERPHTIFVSPLAGIVAVAIGLVLVFMARRSTNA